MLGAVQDGNKFNLSWWKILGDGRAAWGSSSWTDLCWANRNGLGHHLERNSAASHWCFKISTYGWEKCYELLSWLSVYKRDCLIGIYDLFLFLGMSWITVETPQNERVYQLTVGINALWLLTMEGEVEKIVHLVADKFNLDFWIC